MGAGSNPTIPETELICVNCFNGISRYGQGYRCDHCSLEYPIRNGVHIFTRDDLDSHKSSEDAFWRTRSGSLAKNEPAWKTLVNKAGMIKLFSNYALPLLRPEGRILELGAGSGWASSIVKSEWPRCTVYATDIADAAMEKARTLSEICGRTDYFATCDGDRLPFTDELFDRVFSVAFLHHFHSPVNVLKQIRRVLKQGCTYIAFGEIMASQLARPLYRRFSDQRSRSHDLDVLEEAFSFQEWANFFRSAGFKEPHLRLYKEPNFRRNVKGSLYYAIASKLPDLMVKNIMFSTLMISATK